MKKVTFEELHAMPDGTVFLTPWDQSDRNFGYFIKGLSSVDTKMTVDARVVDYTLLLDLEDESLNSKGPGQMNSDVHDGVDIFIMEKTDVEHMVSTLTQSLETAYARDL